MLTLLILYILLSSRTLILTWENKYLYHNATFVERTLGDLVRTKMQSVTTDTQIHLLQKNTKTITTASVAISFEMTLPPNPYIHLDRVQFAIKTNR